MYVETCIMGYYSIVVWVLACVKYSQNAHYDVTIPQGFFCQSKADVKCKQHLLLLKTMYSLPSFLLFFLLPYQWQLATVGKPPWTHLNSPWDLIEKKTGFYSLHRSSCVGKIIMNWMSRITFNVVIYTGKTTDTQLLTDPEMGWSVLSSKYGIWYSERVILQFICLGSWAGVAYLRYVHSADKSQEGRNSCPLFRSALSVLVMLVSQNVFHVISAL